MRIIVISDSHGDYSALESVFLRCSDAEWFVHLGDGERDLDRFIINHPEYSSKIIHVAGNCDSNSLSPSFFVLQVPGHRIFLTHGHRYAVKIDLEILAKTAKEYECDIACYGHTHIRYDRIEDGIHFFNPGSCGCPHDGKAPSFGSIEFVGENVITNITDVKKGC